MLMGSWGLGGNARSTIIDGRHLREGVIIHAASRRCRGVFRGRDVKLGEELVERIIEGLVRLWFLELSFTEQLSRRKR